MNRKLILLILLFMYLPGCAPNINSSDWVCSEKVDCGSGWVCDKEKNLCIEAWNNQNGVYSDKLVLGSSQPLSGAQKDLGNGMTDGIKAYFHHINNIGGIWDRKIELNVIDDSYDPQTALNNVTTLLEANDKQRAFAIIGNGGTPTAAVTQPYITETQRTIFFAPLTGASFLRENPVNRYMFNFRASYSAEAAAIVNYFIEHSDLKLSPNQIAVFAQGQKDQDQILVPDSFGQEGINGVLIALDMEQKDLIIGCYDKSSSTPDEAVDIFCNWLEKAEWVINASESNPVDLGIVMIATPVPAAQFIQKIKDTIAARKLDDQEPLYRNIGRIHCGIISPGGNDTTKEFLEDFGKYQTIQDSVETWVSYTEDTLFTAIVPAPWSMSDAAIKYRDHLAAYNPNLQPGFISFEGYLVAKLFAEGLEENGRDLTTETLVDTFESMTEFNIGIGANVQFGPNDHEACESVWGFLLTGLDSNNQADYNEIDLGL